MKIGISNAQFFAFHGYFAEEQKFGNNFTINVEVEIPNSTYKEEHFSSTVDYSELFKLCQNQMDQTRSLLETVGFSILNDIKTKWPSVIHAKVRIDKIGPQLGGKVGSSYVEMEL